MGRFKAKGLVFFLNPCSLRGGLALLHPVAPGRADVQNEDGGCVFLDLIDNPVNVRLLAVEQMTPRFVFGYDGVAPWVGLQAAQRLRHPVKPPRRLNGGFRFDTLIDTHEITLRTGGDFNAVCHGHAGRTRGSRAPDEYGLWPHPLILAECLPRHQLARQYQASADRLP